MSPIKKVIYETPLNLIVLNKLSLYHMGLRPIFRKIASQKSASQKSIISFPRINNEWIRKGAFLIQYELTNIHVFHVPALRCIYTIMKLCSE